MGAAARKASSAARTALIAVIALLAGCGAAHRPAPVLVPPPLRLGPPAAVNAAIGLSDESPGAFTGAYFRLLRRRAPLSLARLIVPFDNPAPAIAWLANVRAAGLDPYLTLAGDDSCVNPVGSMPATGNCPPPSDAAYIQGFEQLVRALPSVHEWGAWNEPNNYRYWPCAVPIGQAAPPAGACRRTVLAPERAAAYWRDAASAVAALGRADTIVAGETAAGCTAPDFSLCPPAAGLPWSGYVVRYLQALGPLRPGVWATHSYHDIQRHPPLALTETDRFIRFLNESAGAPNVWLTEEGTWLGGVFGSALAGRAAAQALAAREFLELPLVPSAQPGQISREYYYYLRTAAGTRFDSGLLDQQGQPRAAYCVLVGAPPAECRGDPRDEGHPAG